MIPRVRLTNHWHIVSRAFVYVSTEQWITDESIERMFSYITDWLTPVECADSSTGLTLDYRQRLRILMQRRLLIALGVLGPSQAVGFKDIAPLIAPYHKLVTRLVKASQGKAKLRRREITQLRDLFSKAMQTEDSVESDFVRRLCA